ncbi:hydroxypyruvate isomerase [Niastella yeongjuensis]|uniref:Hydroxypyruvate isomerase n=1 Tax=Niastella yeongjuensis TaxID=354355 RepID=A0A1V9EWW4_9BACT|nr:TIM barrel protein [Niastella yeongjuensis]OQP50374.1 hydroxypyruvate isomerase [Niastella yeongjuensis]SEN37230.1 hydroxypyruvate isomerase [Niastella yeongjuensis]
MANQSRRVAIKNLVAGTAALGTANMLTSFNTPEEIKSTALKGNINHSVCRWCYGSIPLEDLCVAVKKIGFSAIDLVGPKDWPTLQKHGIFSSMCNGAELNLVDGWNDKKFHPQLIKNYSEMIPLVAKAGYKQLICFSGSRRGIDDETGWNNCAEGLKQIMSLAEKNKVVIVMELLNSKVNHKDYQCDKTAWGVELCKRVGSENFKLLYDIYHMQIDEGDVIRTIKDNHQYISHYHTGGVPGRNEIDETQELYYPAIMKAIVDLGFKGYVAQEFIPTPKANEEKLVSLEKGIRICDV